MGQCHLPRTQSSAALSALARVSASNLSAPSATPMTPSEHSTQKVSTGGSSVNSGRALTLRQYACRGQWTAGRAAAVGHAWAGYISSRSVQRLHTAHYPCHANSTCTPEWVPPAHPHLSCPLPPARLVLLLRDWRVHNLYD